MSNLQIKDVPDDLHERLRERARGRRQSMRDYVLDLIERDLGRSTFGEWVDRMAARPPLAADLSVEEIADLIRRNREERGDQLVSAFEEARSDR
jgi:hypothetical protein